MGLRDTDKLAYRESFGAGPIQDFLRRAARELQLWIVGGTLPLVADDDAHVLNSSLVFSPEGECVARYDKIHLFHYDNGRERYTEAAVVQAGHTPVTCDITSREGETWRLGLSVCYDLRFPELYRRLAEQGADLLLVPAAFTHIRSEEHTSELQSQSNLVCRLLLEKKKQTGGRPRHRGARTGRRRRRLARGGPAT